MSNNPDKPSMPHPSCEARTCGNPNCRLHEFELWASSDGYRIDHNFPASGAYLDERTFAALEGWQAATEAHAADSRQLRALLANYAAHPMFYHDDGELSDCSVHPFIDFLRDSPERIKQALYERGVARLKAQLDLKS